MSSSNSSSSSSSSSKTEWIYDVFFSFFSFSKSEWIYDKHFASRLNLDLQMDGVRTFFDDQIRNQNHISSSHLQAIQGSRISFVFLSRNYADSSWCLQELEKIMECHRTVGQVVFPVFYQVNAGDVRRQKGKFGEAFEGLIKRLSVMTNTELSWRRSLAEVAFHSGLDLSIVSETKAIKSIFVSVHQILDSRHLSPPRYPVGIEFQAQNIFQRLNYNLDKVHMVGIWGTGGMGKTTIAKAIYNRLSHSFEGSSFLANINNVWQQDNGQDYLQKQLISDICNTSNTIINSTDMENTKMEKILCHKRALVVLDDVKTGKQLMSFCGSREWFGRGSIVFITTRHKFLLDHLEVDHVYEMKKMDPSDSLQLLSWHAFKQFSPTNNFIKLSRRAITCCGGVPLALEVFGSFFLDREVSEWKSVLKRLEGNTSNTIQEILKVCYDHLDDSEKDIFLEVASLYIGKDRYTVTQILNSCGLPAEKGISVLIERSLIKVDKNNKLEMHELLQEMGKGINGYKPKAKWIYNVFLSFRGEDVRRSFASHLYSALKNAGIEVFMDNRIEIGEHINSSLFQAIEDSRISIIIFSTNYAGSSWCLREVEKIMECYRNIRQEVLPVFHGVEPSEVRKQTGTFGKALEGLMQRTSAKKDEIISWRRALTEAANLSGLDLKNYRTETELINDLVKSVTTKLDDNTYLSVTDHPVGVNSHVQNMIQLLSDKPNEVLIVGILGMGGVGKTTIAKATYNEIAQNFGDKIFLANIREFWDQDNGDVYLQEQLLSSILRRSMKIHRVDMGKTKIKESLWHKKALVVLDDIDKLDQFHALCGSREWFGQGSRIIITTRDMRLLNVLQVDHVYKMKEMDESESLELFSWHAFKQPAPIENFVELSSKVVAYAGGLPLALEVLGSYLLDRAIAEWESVLSKLKTIPNNEIHKILKLSFDGLSDDMEKDIFLDICCFFIGKNRHYVTQILNGCGLHAEIGIAVLIERNLVKVDKNNKFEMHALLQAMGKEIIREKSPEEPEKRSRLWSHDEVRDVLIKNTGTIAIKGLAFNLQRNNRDSFNIKSFKKMKRLRLLQLGHVKLAGDFEYLSKDLRWLCWRGFPLRYMPENFYQENLVAIDLKYSNLKQVWKKSQLLDRLKVLNLSHSHYLIQTPDFSRLPHLEKLIFKDCPCLSMVHPTIGDLQHIILINLKDCNSLSDLPRSIYKLKSLKSLILSGCSKIKRLEEDIEQLESLTTLMADNTAITQVPVSLVRSKSITYISLCGYEGLSRHVFPSLIRSWMTPTKNPKLPIQAFGSMSSLLQSLSLSHASSTRNCTEIVTRPGKSHISNTDTSTLIHFHDQVCIAGSENFVRSLIIQVGGCNQVNDALLESISQGWTNKVCESDDKYPDWLSFEGLGSSVLFQVPLVGRNLKGITLCSFYSSSLANMTPECTLFSFLMINHTKAIIQSYKQDSVSSFRDEEWQDMISNLEAGDQMEVAIVLGQRFTVTRTTIYLIYGESIHGEIMECSSATQNDDRVK